MKTYRLATLILGLVLALGGLPSWGQNPSSNDISDGNDNTGGGTGALVSVTSGDFNTAYGHSALGTNSTGILNTGFGQCALCSNSSGAENTAVGAGALQNNNGNSNTAVGFQALFSNTTSGNNTAVGLNALFANTGHDNTATGTVALQANTTGSKNVAYGSFALEQNTTGLAALQNNGGSNNIALGFQAGFKLTTGNNNIDIGAFTEGVAAESNTLRIGTGLGLARTFVGGISGVPVTGSQGFGNSKGQLGIAASSERYKRDIQTMGDRSRRLYQLRPVTFHYKFDPDGPQQYGLVAEEVAKIYPDLVTRDADGKIQAVQYHELIPMLLNELQHQQQELANLEAQNKHLRATATEQNASFAARLARLEAAAQNGGPNVALSLSPATSKVGSQP